MRPAHLLCARHFARPWVYSNNTDTETIAVCHNPARGVVLIWAVKVDLFNEGGLNYCLKSKRSESNKEM